MRPFSVQIVHTNTGQDKADLGTTLGNNEVKTEDGDKLGLNTPACGKIPAIESTPNHVNSATRIGIIFQIIMLRKPNNIGRYDTAP